MHLQKERAWLEGFAQTIRTGGASATNPALANADLKGNFLHKL